VIDENMKDQIRITVIATGFDHSGGLSRRASRVSSAVIRTTATKPLAAEGETAEQARPVSIDHNNLELPSFLRRR